MKRLLDILLSSLALVCLAPLMLWVAVLIRVASPGPALFWQQRVGRREELFWLVKFRSMHVAAPGSERSCTTIDHDPRVTLLGAKLRRWKIDELPQLFNVLTGQMTLVGPRPTVMEDHIRMSPEQRRRVVVRPGLTGLAQLRGGASIPWPQRIELDLQYIEHMSLALDFQLIAETVWQLATGQADRMPVRHDEWSDAA